MVRDHGAKGINTGFWIARGSLFSFRDFAGLASRAESVKQFFCPETQEQPFFNFCLDTKRINYGHLSAAIKDFPECSWGQLQARYCGGIWYCSEKYNTRSVPLYMVHWAGTGLGWDMANRRIFFDAFFLGRGFASRLFIRVSWYTIYLRNMCIRFLKRLFRNPGRL
jgi:hypothetical protein